MYVTGVDGHEGKGVTSCVIAQCCGRSWRAAQAAMSGGQSWESTSIAPFSGQDVLPSAFECGLSGDTNPEPMSPC